MIYLFQIYKPWKQIGVLHIEASSKEEALDIFNKEYKDFNSILELKIREISNGT